MTKKSASLETLADTLKDLEQHIAEMNTTLLSFSETLAQILDGFHDASVSLVEPDEEPEKDKMERTPIAGPPAYQQRVCGGCNQWPCNCHNING